MSEKIAHKMFDSIDKDSIIKASKNGYKYCRTLPFEHPFGEKRGDRNARYVYLHRATYELAHGHYIHPERGDQVDHKDGNKNNNDPKNLILVKIGPHQATHTKGENGHKRNKFWNSSPLTKPGCKRKKKASIESLAYRVVLSYLRELALIEGVEQSNIFNVEP